MFRPAASTGVVLAAAALAAALATAGCRDITSPAQDPTTVAFAPGLGIRLSEFTRDTSGVYYHDDAVGSGPVAVANSTLSYYYTGYLANGRTFGTNQGSQSPLTVVLGAGQVVRGFDRGLLGIRQGGRRHLIIPPALGYGNQSSGNTIPAGSVLIFVVDVPVVTPPATTTTNRMPN
ncbi:MAG TPA: FKBP-type peptidyl-prolyl cis-trans isomerase [Gemmatirosa sp.]